MRFFLPLYLLILFFEVSAKIFPSSLPWDLAARPIFSLKFIAWVLALVETAVEFSSFLPSLRVTRLVIRGEWFSFLERAGRFVPLFGSFPSYAGSFFLLRYQKHTVLPSKFLPPALAPAVRELCSLFPPMTANTKLRFPHMNLLIELPFFPPRCCDVFLPFPTHPVSHYRPRPLSPLTPHPTDLSPRS